MTSDGATSEATSSDRSDIIVCEGVEKWYGDFQALKGIPTTVREGEVVVVFGPSGSGKSTFIPTPNRLEQHDAGRIRCDGWRGFDDECGPATGIGPDGRKYSLHLWRR